MSVAARRYEETEGGLELCAMNVLYESLKTGSTTIIIPTSAANFMGLEQTGGIARALAAQSTASGTVA